MDYTRQQLAQMTEAELAAIVHDPPSQKAAKITSLGQDA